jgi:hypothetical protein
MDVLVISPPLIVEFRYTMPPEVRRADTDGLQRARCLPCANRTRLVLQSLWLECPTRAMYTLIVGLISMHASRDVYVCYIRWRSVSHIECMSRRTIFSYDVQYRDVSPQLDTYQRINRAFPRYLILLSLVVTCGHRHAAHVVRVSSEYSS